MPETTVVHVRDVDLSDPDVVYIGRRSNRARLAESVWGNPYIVGNKPGNREASIDLYEAYIRESMRVEPNRYDIETLRGKRLACWCSPLKCHGSILIKLLTERSPNV